MRTKLPQKKGPKEGRGGVVVSKKEKKKKTVEREGHLLKERLK